MCNQFYCFFETEQWFLESYLISWIQRSQFKCVQSTQYLYIYIQQQHCHRSPHNDTTLSQQLLYFYELWRTNVSPIRSPKDIRFNWAGKLCASPSQQGSVCLGSSKDKFIYLPTNDTVSKRIKNPIQELGSDLVWPRRLTPAMLTTRRCSSQHISVLYAQWHWVMTQQMPMHLKVEFATWGYGTTDNWHLTFKYEFKLPNFHQPPSKQQPTLRHAADCRNGAGQPTVYGLLGSAENLLQHGAYGSTFRAFQKSVFQIIILKTALWIYMKTWAQLCFVI